MAGKADVQGHLNKRREPIAALFDEWSNPGLSDDSRTDLVERYLKESDLGETHRVGTGASLHVPAPHVDPKRVNVLVIGRHDLEGLAPVGPRPFANAVVSGPGIASRLGPTVAFVEGLQAARSLTVEEPLNINLLSLGADDTFASIGGPDLFAGKLDAVFMTNATTWSPHHPTLTTGSRGELVAQVRLESGASVNDYIASGAVRNPLTTMTQILGRLRDHHGRIALPGFYDRAQAPDDGMRSALTADGHDPNEWADHMGVAQPGGRLSSLERASLWPGVSVLRLDADTDDGRTAPASVTATIAFYLIPGQRHAEVEHALREWFADQAPADSNPSVRLVSSTRPYRVAPDSPAVAAQARAAFRLHGRHPILVPAGGPSGAGELAFAAATPVAFAGIAPPSPSYGTHSEAMPWSQFDAGVALGAETCLQLRRV